MTGLRPIGLQIARPAYSRLSDNLGVRLEDLFNPHKAAADRRMALNVCLATRELTWPEKRIILARLCFDHDLGAHAYAKGRTTFKNHLVVGLTQPDPDLRAAELAALIAGRKIIITLAGVKETLNVLMMFDLANKQLAELAMQQLFPGEKPGLPVIGLRSDLIDAPDDIMTVGKQPERGSALRRLGRWFWRPPEETLHTSLDLPQPSTAAEKKAWTWQLANFFWRSPDDEG